MTSHIRVPIDNRWHMAEEAITGLGFYCMSLACRAVYVKGEREIKPMAKKDSLTVLKNQLENWTWVRIRVPDLDPNMWVSGIWVESGSEIKQIRFYSMDIAGEAITFGVSDVE